MGNKDIEFCTACKKPFYVLEIPMGVGGGKDREDIDCPYEGHTVGSRMTDGWFKTVKMDQKEIEEYFKGI